MNKPIDTSLYNGVSEAVRKEASRILSDGTVTAVVGYASARREGSSQPIVITKAEDASKLIFSSSCVNNLSVYLTKAKKEIPKSGRIAIVAKGCDLKALAGLLRESQIKRENLYIIGVPCVGVLSSITNPDRPLSEENIAAKCTECETAIPEGCDFVANAEISQSSGSLEKKYASEIARLEAMKPEERWAYWKMQFSKCIKCYACRQVCPFCFCEQCLCDRNRPQMVESTPRPSGNFAWHIVRAMHLAGRCAGCAECERVCPMDIPLNLLNRKMAKELKELYDYESGFTAEGNGPLATYSEGDDQSFIK